MRFKFDENVPLAAVEPVAESGHDVESVVSQDMSGAEDSQLADVVDDEERILVTFDTDFANIGAYPPQEYPGFIVLRPKRQDLHSAVGRIEELLPLLETNFEKGSLWIVEEGRIRKR